MGLCEPQEGHRRGWGIMGSMCALGRALWEVGCGGVPRRVLLGTGDHGVRECPRKGTAGCNVS